MNYSWILDNQINLKQPSHSIEDQNVARFEKFKTLANFKFFFSIPLHQRIMKHGPERLNCANVITEAMKAKAQQTLNIFIIL